jgi:F-type H+-transporting ATPase subunit delta
VADPVRDLLEGARDQLQAAGPRVLPRVADELFGLASLLSDELRLRRALADPALPAQVKRGLLAELLGSRAHQLTLALLGQAVTGPRMRPVVLVDAVERLGAEALFTKVEGEGRLDDVEDQLFRFARLVEREQGLRLALADPVLPVDRKLALVDALLGGRAEDVTVRLVRQVVRSPRGRLAERAIDELARAAAAFRGRVVAVVTTAVALDDERAERLAAALSRAQGRTVRLQVVVDPAIMGGVIVRIGDEIIDGSVRRQLARARDELG